MNYHDTMPSESGFYLDIRSSCTLQLLAFFGGTFTDERGENTEPFFPLIGPLPATQEEAIALACEVAFARMEVARSRSNTKDRLLLTNYIKSVGEFLRRRTHPLSLLRDMERVTSELTK